MALAFGFNLYTEGVAIDWQLAKQGARFVYLGADGGYIANAAAARAEGLKVGAYWGLKSSIDPAEQLELFWRRLGDQAKKEDLPPAVWCYDAKQTPALKRLVELLERRTQRPTLIGGTPSSLKQAGVIFGRSNPLWISHKPLYGGPSLPAGWSSFAVWQTEPEAQHKGIGGKVGHNGAQAKFLGGVTLAETA